MHANSTATIHDLFRRRAAASPDAVALTWGAARFSYAELDRLSETLAGRLEDAGVGAGATVALIMDRAPEMFIAMLAILKCGAAYLPLEPNTPPARAMYCLDAAGGDLVITDRDCRALSGAFRKTLRFQAQELAAAPVPVREAKDVAADAPAYIMFTSGTTSEPKGVVVPHRGVTRLVIDTNYIAIAPADAILQCSTPSFDASTLEIWGALLNGATLVLYTGAVLDPNLFRRHIVEHGVTIAWLTAAVFHLFAESCLDALRPLKVLLAGGDVLRPAAVRKVLDAIEGITLVNGYGPTENTTFTCCHVMTRANPPGATVPIGRPVSGTEVFILDPERRPVAAGATGELYTAGQGVALGYLNSGGREGAFFRDPALAAGLIYRTGDLVRMNEHGQVEFLGRQDNEIKLRGYRISLGEVRSNLLALAGVREAVVSCQKKEGGDQLLVAYVQVNEGQGLDARSVRKQLSGTVPPYMIPDQIAVGTALPINKNGKIDSKKLFSTAA